MDDIEMNIRALNDCSGSSLIVLLIVQGVLI